MTVSTVPVYGGVVPDPNSQSPNDFSTNAVAWTAYQAVSLVPGVNTSIAEFNIDVGLVNGYKDAAASSAADALVSENNAADSALTAQSLANFKGRWSDATGAATIGSSYSHNGSTWRVEVAIADITLSEPSRANTDWQIINDVNISNVNVSKINNAIVSILKTNKPVETLIGTLSSSNISSQRYYTDRYGFLRTVSADEIREEGEGFLVRNSSTNLLLHSIDASNAAWSKVGDLSITANNTTSCIEGELADELSSATGGSANRLAQSISITDTGQDVTIDFIVAKGTVTDQRIRIVSTGGTTLDLGATFDYTTETFSSISPGATPRLVKRLANGFYWLSLSITLNGTNTNVQAWTYSSGAGSWYFAGAQLQEACYSNSLIVTTASSASQNADDLTIPMLCNIPSVEEDWSLIVGVSVVDDINNLSDRVILNPDFGSQNGFYFDVPINTKNLRLIFNAVTLFNSATDLSEPIFIVLTHNKQNATIELYVNKELKATSNVASYPTPNISGVIGVGGRYDVSTQKLDGNIKGLVFLDHYLNQDEVKYLGGVI